MPKSKISYAAVVAWIRITAVSAICVPMIWIANKMARAAAAIKWRYELKKLMAADGNRLSVYHLPLPNYELADTKILILDVDLDSAFRTRNVRETISC